MSNIDEKDFIYCKHCSKKNDKSSKFCSNCGKPLQENPLVLLDENNNQNRDIIRCPKCGSTNIHFVTTQASQNFDKGDACCGYLLCGPLGLLCGMKDKTESKTVRKCMSCTHEF